MFFYRAGKYKKIKTYNIPYSINDKYYNRLIQLNVYNNENIAKISDIKDSLQERYFEEFQEVDQLNIEMYEEITIDPIKKWNK